MASGTIKNFTFGQESGIYYYKNSDGFLVQWGQVIRESGQLVSYSNIWIINISVTVPVSY